MVAVANPNPDTSTGLATTLRHYPMVDVDAFRPELEAAGFALERMAERWYIFYVHHVTPSAIYAREMLVRRILVGELYCDGRIIATDNTNDEIFLRWLYRRFGACERLCDTCRWCKLQEGVEAQAGKEGAEDANSNGH